MANNNEILTAGELASIIADQSKDTPIYVQTMKNGVRHPAKFVVIQTFKGDSVMDKDEIKGIVIEARNGG